MKLLINNQITLTYKYRAGPEDFEDNAYDEYQDFIDYESKLLDSMCIHHTVINHYTSLDFILEVQEITLDEHAMNDLFFSVLNSFDTKFNIKYVPLGGAGCDFCIELYKDK